MNLPIMNELGLPLPLSKAYADIWRKVIASGREIDQEFIRRGFVSIKAEIDFFHRVFGPMSYEVFLNAQSENNAFERFRAHCNEVDARLIAADKSSAAELDVLWNMVIEDLQLDAFFKRSALMSLSPERLDALLEDHIPAILESQREEQRRVCRLYPAPAIPLFDRETTALRKEVYNSVMADAYGALGFTVFKRKRNLDIYAKALSPEYAVIIEPDALLLEKQYNGHRFFPTTYWPLITFDRVCYLGSSKKQDHRRWMTFLPPHNCIAATRRRYDDTRSLEVVIRADALWYELTIAPFEKFVREYAEPSG